MVRLARPGVRAAAVMVAALMLAPVTASASVAPSTMVSPLQASVQTSPVFTTSQIMARRAVYRSKRVVYFVNRRRLSHGLNKVRLNSCVDRYANGWAVHLARDNGFYHSNLYRLIDDCHTSYASENIAWLPPNITARHLVSLWMNSPDHRHNILSRHPRTTGVGYVWDADENAFLVVQNFAR
jgi:uncharacterized protein YkwD